MKRFALLVLSFTATGAVAHDVQKKVLNNGLTVLVRPVPTMQNVSVQLWYNVGSKDEKTGERGLAHLLEHMVFKGTKKKLSESDIPEITHKLSGSCNAHTSVDTTWYHFDMPVQHWKEVLPVLSDCMTNCAFKQDLLNAEFKVVIQELKMNRDKPLRCLVEKMFSALFHDHPYHYPTIGYKQDLWTVMSNNLHDFYKKHYVPNNAALVVVGNVEPEEVFSQAQHHFGAIKPDKKYKKETFFHNQDLITQEVFVYRDVASPQVVCAYSIPGIGRRNNYAVDVLLYALGSGKSSRITRKLVDELQLANSVDVATVDHAEHDILFFLFEPRDLDDVQNISHVIQEELNDIAANGLSEHEHVCAATQIKADVCSLLENNYAQGKFIGKYFFATGDEQYLTSYCDQDPDIVQQEVRDFVGRYCTSLHMHRGAIVPLAEEGRDLWKTMQQESDHEDSEFLKHRQRTSPVEPPKYARTLQPRQAQVTTVKLPDTFSLSNGVSVVSSHRDTVPKIELILELEPHHDPIDRQGLYYMFCSMLYEGTTHYPGMRFAQELDDNAISFSISPKFIKMSMLSERFEKGLELLQEVVMHASFTKGALEKVKHQARSRYQLFWDSPHDVAGFIARQKVYSNHPYSLSPYPDEQVVSSVTCEELYEWYNHVMTPHGASIAVVGDVNGYDVRTLLENYLGAWEGSKNETTYPELQPLSSDIVNHYMNRDQVVIKYAGLSVPYTHDDFNALLLFDQIISGGLSSRLFKLRMHYGYFYASSASLVSGADRQPGMVTIETMVSKDNVAQAEAILEDLITTVVDSITEEEVEDAKRMVLNRVTSNYANTRSLASTLLFLHRHNLPYDYFATYHEKINALSVERVKEAARSVLKREHMVLIKVGRLD